MHLSSTKKCGLAGIVLGFSLVYLSTLSKSDSVIGGFGPVTVQGPYSAAGTALPTCNASLKGALYYVSDATSPTYGGTYTSGGAVYALAFCNGSAWSMH
jgi:hypothetical protein